MKDENPETPFVHCVIYGENIESKNITPVLNEVINSVKRCINVTKANAKCESLVK